MASSQNIEQTRVHVRAGEQLLAVLICVALVGTAIGIAPIVRAMANDALSTVVAKVAPLIPTYRP